jgi:hypothetical protein
MENQYMQQTRGWVVAGVRLVREFVNRLVFRSVPRSSFLRFTSAFSKDTATPHSWRDLDVVELAELDLRRGVPAPLEEGRDPLIGSRLR